MFLFRVSDDILTFTWLMLDLTNDFGIDFPHDHSMNLDEQVHREVERYMRGFFRDENAIVVSTYVATYDNNAYYVGRITNG